MGDPDAAASHPATNAPRVMASATDSTAGPIVIDGLLFSSGLAILSQLFGHALKPFFGFNRDRIEFRIIYHA